MFYHCKNCGGPMRFGYNNEWVHDYNQKLCDNPEPSIPKGVLFVFTAREIK